MGLVIQRRAAAATAAENRRQSESGVGQTAQPAAVSICDPGLIVFRRRRANREILHPRRYSTSVRRSSSKIRVRAFAGRMLCRGSASGYTHRRRSRGGGDRGLGPPTFRTGG